MSETREKRLEAAVSRALGEMKIWRDMDLCGCDGPDHTCGFRRLHLSIKACEDALALVPVEPQPPLEDWEMETIDRQKGVLVKILDIACDPEDGTHGPKAQFTRIAELAQNEVGVGEASIEIPPLTQLPGYQPYRGGTQS